MTIQYNVVSLLCQQSPNILRGPGRVVCPGARSGSRRACADARKF